MGLDDDKAQPVNPGHVFIIPKPHAPYLADLDSALGGHIFATGMRVVLR